ncbi:MAG: hypothetical protein KME01_11175 [Chroococcus sp. CMT-3BRIN-NPC107]|jgi:hypothetical protein|nr:hypothetical protein [Chroococcus sp. CMT-3BRIN-NPC107]
MLGFLFGGLVKKFERAAKNISQNFGESTKKEVDYLFDIKLTPFAEQLDYTLKNRVLESNYEVEKLETKVKNDIESLLNNVDTKTNKNIERINRLRQDAIDGLEQTIDKTDNYLVNRINQISLVVMETLASTEGITKEILLEISELEDKLFKDAEQLINKLIDAIYYLDKSIEAKIERIQNEVKKYLAHPFPNPFDKCKQRLNIQWKYGSRISDIELYKLSNCYELNKLNEQTPIDDVIEIYGQLQLNALRMVVLVSESPELKRRAIQDWIEYGMLCDFWLNIARKYASTDFFIEGLQTNQKLLVNPKD